MAAGVRGTPDRQVPASSARGHCPGLGLPVIGDMADATPITFKIDDRELTAAPGTLVIEAARREGIEVPSFCYYPGLSLQAACRMCLVEVEKAPKLQTACTLVAMNGMVVRTNTEQVHAARKSMLEFLLTNHPLDCPVCDKGGEC